MRSTHEPFAPIFIKPHAYVPEAEIRMVWQPKSLRKGVKEIFVELPDLSDATKRIEDIAALESKFPCGNVLVID